MPESQKEHINEILEDMVERRWSRIINPHTIFDFVKFEAKLSVNKRAIEIHPTEILGSSKLKPGHKDFDRLLLNWKQGWGLKLDGSSGRKVQIN